MSDLKHFDEIEYKATDSQYAKDYAHGYNDCLANTNAKELRDILTELLRCNREGIGQGTNWIKAYELLATTKPFEV